jgi:hypothetical protein
MVLHDRRVLLGIYGPICIFDRHSWYLCYSAVSLDMLIPLKYKVIPFRLEKLGYPDPSALTGWLMVVYVSELSFFSSSLTFLQSLGHLIGTQTETA